MMAARELLRRRRARRSLVDYSQAITIPGAPVADDPDGWLFVPVESRVAAHHVLTMQAIERCICEDYGRLIIMEPPGSAKSTYASVVATTWAMGVFPGLRVLMTSYAGTPITRHAKRARQIVMSDGYAAIFGARLVDGSKAADEWELTNGSGMYAAGLMGGLTSSRCDLGIIDDPVAGREEADSEAIRRKTLDAYHDDFLTRLKPGASVILIQTRWHENDLAGSILPEDYDGRSGAIACRDGQTWDVLNLPARCERNDDPLGRKPGEYLWPEWFTPEHWSIYEREPRTWSALYQQRPAPETGIFFQRDDFVRSAHQPANLRVYMASDFAVTAKGGDWTEHGVWGIDERGELYALDWWSGRETSDVSIDAAIDLIAKWRPTLWIGEKGVIESSIGPAVERRMRERRVFAKRHLLPTSGDKVARARGFMGRVAAHTVHFPETRWADDAITELCAFPAAAHDDKVDVCGLIGRALDVIADATPADKPKPAPPQPFTDAWFAARDRANNATDAEKAVYYR